LRVQIVGSMRHVEVDEICGRDQPRHAGSVIEAVTVPERGDQVTEIDGRQTAANAFTINAMAVGAGICIDHSPTLRIGCAIELRHAPGPHAGQNCAARHTGRQELDIGDQRQHLGAVLR
jgi:hypothetical protein